VLATQDLRRHGCRGRLAVGRGHDGDAVRKSRRKLVDRTRIELPENLAGDGRATSATRDA
jgi:hypothetical protein